MDTTVEVVTETEQVSGWLLKRALPWWTEHAVDAKGALAHEEFTFEGAPKETGIRRTLVQFRQIYVFAHAALLGRCSPSLPLRLFERVSACAWVDEGGWAHRLTPDGSIADRTRDLYDQAFALLACAWVHGLTRQSEPLAWAERTLTFLDAQMASASGGYVEALPPRLPRRQNPHMHLFEALLALHEVTGSPSYLTRASQLRTLLSSRFVSEHGALRESFGPNWAPLSAGAGTVVEPGHHFEWVWLLHEHARLSGLSPEPLSSQLFRFAMTCGLDEQGLAIEQLDATGRPERRSIKLWALTEQLKALIARAEIEGRTHDARIAPLVDALFRRFLVHPHAPIWYEGCDERGLPDRRRMPASTLYHLTVSFLELLRWRRQVPRALTHVQAGDDGA